MSNPIHVYEATVILPTGYQVRATASAEYLYLADRMIRAQYPQGSTLIGLRQID